MSRPFSPRSNAVTETNCDELFGEKVQLKFLSTAAVSGLRQVVDETATALQFPNSKLEFYLMADLSSKKFIDARRLLAEHARSAEAKWKSSSALLYFIITSILADHENSQELESILHSLPDVAAEHSSWFFVIGSCQDLDILIRVPSHVPFQRKYCLWSRPRWCSYWNTSNNIRKLPWIHRAFLGSFRGLHSLK